jgi:mannose-6-phosphate isomerase-like protein (cupin superfamily)
MSDYTVLRAADAPDYSGEDTPGAFRGYASTLGSEELGVNLRVLEPGQANVPPGFDEKAGHSHTGIDEIYFVLEGEVSVKVGDDVVTLGPRDAIRIPPEVTRSTRNDGDKTAAVLMVSPKMSDPQGQSHFEPDFWTD